MSFETQGSRQNSNSFHWWHHLHWCCSSLPFIAACCFDVGPFEINQWALLISFSPRYRKTRYAKNLGKFSGFLHLGCWYTGWYTWGLVLCNSSETQYFSLVPLCWWSIRSESYCALEYSWLPDTHFYRNIQNCSGTWCLRAFWIHLWGPDSWSRSWSAQWKGSRIGMFSLCR